MPISDKKRLLAAFCKNAQAHEIEQAFTLLASDPSLRSIITGENEQSGGLPRKAPSLWHERTTGRSVSPADFIRLHYTPWFEKGLTRAHLVQLDKPLYTAYAQQVHRTPEKLIPELPSEVRVKRDDPVEALERIRAQARENFRRAQLRNQP